MGSPKSGDGAPPAQSTNCSNAPPRRFAYTPAMLELAPARVASEEYASCWTPPHETTLTMQADSFGWGALWAALGAIFGTIIAGFSAWLTQRSKGDSERDVAVL